MSSTPTGDHQRRSSNAPASMQTPSRPQDDPLADPSPDPVVVVHASAAIAASAVALEMADLIETHERPVLGLATGGTMVEVYAALVAHVRDRGLDVGHVTTFNLDEYMGIDPDSKHSFRRFMSNHLFEPLGFDTGKTHFPNAELAASDPSGAARAFEELIDAAGGLDLQLLGLGRNGHIAFNEPGSPFGSRTRVVDLAPKTRSDAAMGFGGLDSVPTQGITMGIGTILEARALRVLAFGAPKSEVVRASLHGEESEAVPSTCLRTRHGNVQFHLDPLAGSLLPGYALPQDDEGALE